MSWTTLLADQRVALQPTSKQELDDAARRKRNDFSYDTPVSISETDADELVQVVQQFQQDAEKWIHAKDPTLT